MPLSSQPTQNAVKSEPTLTHAEAQDIEYGPRNHAGQHPRGHKVVNGVRVEHTEGVHLLRNLTRIEMENGTHKCGIIGRSPMFCCRFILKSWS